MYNEIGIGKKKIDKMSCVQMVWLLLCFFYSRSVRQSIMFLFLSQKFLDNTAHQRISIDENGRFFFYENGKENGTVLMKIGSVI